MKVRSSIRSLANAPGSKVVRRKGRIYVINKTNPRFKAQQGEKQPGRETVGARDRLLTALVIFRRLPG